MIMSGWWRCCGGRSSLWLLALSFLGGLAAAFVIGGYRDCYQVECRERFSGCRGCNCSDLVGRWNIFARVYAMVFILEVPPPRFSRPYGTGSVLVGPSRR